MVSAWLVIQVVETIFPIYGLPDAYIRIIITLLGIGLVPVMVLAWAFELTPEGLKKDRGADFSRPSPAHTGKKLDRAIMVVLALALGYFAFDKFVLDPQREADLREQKEAEVQQALQKGRTEGRVESYGDRSIAVLAFQDMSQNKDQEYLSDGIAEELLNLLAKVPELRVISRSSAFSFKGKDVKLAHVAEELNVAHILEGSVRKAGNQIRITAQLIEARSDTHLWSETYDRQLDDIFAIQDEIAEAVVSSLKTEILGVMPKSSVTKPEAYTYLMQGRYFENLKGSQNWAKAYTAYQHALSIDPDYGPTWVAMASIYNFQIRNGLIPKNEGVALSTSALNRALVIDDTQAEALASLARLKSRYKWDWKGAKADIDEAMKLEPHNAEVVSMASELALYLGQLIEAKMLMEQAIELDPLNLTNLSSLGQQYLHLGHSEDAMTMFNRVIDLNPQYPWIYEKLGRTYLQKGDVESATIEFDKYPDESILIRFRTELLLAQGMQEKAQITLDQLIADASNRSPIEVATAYVLRGDHNQAFEWLKTAYVQRDVDLAFILVNRAFFPLKDDPRWVEFLQQLNLLEYWLDMPAEYGGPTDLRN